MAETLGPVVVQKYGGSSVADDDKIRRVAERIVATRNQGKRVVAVVSAMGKTTDELLAMARRISASPSRRELDMLLSCGERMSMSLLSMAIMELGVEAISFTGSQCGIMTNDRHSGARIIEVRPIRVEDELDRGRVVVVAGFQGVSYKREVTTLGRGGSDTTAVALAAALGAEYCEICSDVDGVYNADPRVVSGAALLEAISCDSMLELAAHGAKVLHKGCVEIARRSRIALYARATARLDSGTRIDPPGPGANVDAIAVTGQKQLVRVRAVGDECVERVLAAASAARVPPLHLDTDMESADLWFGLSDVPDWPMIRSQLGDDLEILEDVGAVSVVGDGMGDDPTRLQRARQTARDAGVEIVAMSTSPLRVSLFCAQDAVDDLVRALHAQLVVSAR